MKLPLALLVASSIAVFAGDLRKWTQAETKKTIEGTITDKKSDSSSAQIITTDDRTVWLEAKTLLPADQDYIKKWIEPKERLTVRVVGTKEGKKTLKVTYAAGSTPLHIKSNRSHDIKIKAGGTGEFTFSSYDPYWVAVYVEGKEIDRETDKSKTGL